MKERFIFRIVDKVFATDGSVLATPLSDDESGVMGPAVDASFPAPVYVAGTITSTFDLAWELTRDRELPAWSGVLAASQTHGRGQFRREWISPLGNLYVSFFLPEDFARLGDMASIAVGYCIQAALREMGVATLLKWPNDILLCEKGQIQGKLGGLLLEERGGRLLAGLGLNCRYAPEKARLRENTVVPAVTLPAFDTPLSPFWGTLVTRMQDVFARRIENASLLEVRKQAEFCLAWKGRQVWSDEAGSVGTLVGLDEKASAVLETKTGLIAVSSGSISPV